MKITYGIISLTLVLGYAGPALAKTISKQAFHAAQTRAESEYTTAKQKCDSLSGNAKDICVVEAKGALKVAKADAEAEYQGTDRARLKAAEAKVDAEYQAAKERCDDLSGNQKAVCQKEAKAAQVKGEAEAKLSQKKSAARHEFNATENKAHQEAGQADRDAEFEVAIQKCERFAGVSRDQCVTATRSRFGK